MTECAKKTILLVEDESIIALAETRMLTKNGYFVRTAYSGSSAVDYVRNKDAIDLVLMDLDLGPGMDGAEAAERILSARNLPVLFLSSHTESEVVERTEHIPSYGYVVKNSGERILLASIAMAFKLFESRTKYQEKVEELEATNIRLEAALAEGRRFAEALGEREAELRSLVDAVPAGVCVLLNRSLVKVNAAMSATYGYSESELLGKSTRLLYLDDEEFERVGRELYDALIGRRSATIETRHRTKDGRILDILVGASAMDRESADPRARVACVLFNITEKRRGQEALRSREALLAGLFRSCPESVALTSLEDGRFIEVNDASCRMSGYSREELVGRSVEELGLWCSPLDRAKVVDRLKQGGLVRNFETKLRKKDGGVIDALMSMTTFEAGGRVCLLGFVTDISRRKRMEAALGDSLREGENLLRELQHRIRNGLAMIASMMQLELGRSDERMSVVLGNLKNRVDSMSALYDLFAKSGSADNVDLRDYLGVIVDALSEAHADADGRVCMERTLAEARVDSKSALSWGLITNELVTNAFKYAFPPGACGVIRVDLAESPDAIELSVSDKGVGLPSDFDLERSGGLGLDIVRMMTLQLKGELSVIREGGTSFLIRVPKPGNGARRAS